jgi:integrase/recombinase XerD
MSSLATIYDPELFGEAMKIATAMATIDRSQLWSEDEMVEAFLDHKGKNSANTRAAYGRDLGHYRSFLALTFNGEIGLAPGDAGAVDEYAAFLREQVELEALAKSTANRRMAALSSFYGWASKARRRAKTGIWSNPVDFEGYKLQSNFSDRALTEAQVIKLLDAAANPTTKRVRYPERDATLIRLLYQAAVRVSEAAGLKWKHLAVSEDGSGVLHIIGKGGKDRWVCVSAELVAALQALPGEHDKETPIFTSERGGKMDRDTIAAIVGRCGRAIGVDNLTPHALRHTHATHAIQRGVSPDLVKQTLGHSSLAITSNYLKANPKDSSGLHLVA